MEIVAEVMECNTQITEGDKEDMHACEALSTFPQLQKYFRNEYVRLDFSIAKGIITSIFYLKFNMHYCKGALNLQTSKVDKSFLIMFAFKWHVTSRETGSWGLQV